MIACSSTRRSLWLAGVLGALLAAAPAFAQQTGDQPSAQPALLDLAYFLAHLR